MDIDNSAIHKLLDEVKGWKLETENYPTKMHEILTDESGRNGVKSWEEFGINTLNGKYMVTPSGNMIQVGGETCHDVCEADGFAYRRAINFGIIRDKKLTSDQLYALKALYKVLGINYLVREKDGSLWARGGKAEKSDKGYWITACDNYYTIKLKNPLFDGLCSWSDPAPLNVLDTLKDNGVVF